MDLDLDGQSTFTMATMLKDKSSESKPSQLMNAAIESACAIQENIPVQDEVATVLLVDDQTFNLFAF